MILNKTILGVCLCAITGLALAELAAPESRMYMGTNAQVRYTNFDKKFGKAVMRKKHNQGHIFIGFKLSDDLSVEVGRESLVSRSKKTILTEGEVFNGIRIPKEFSPSAFVTNMNLKSMNLDMTYYIRMFDDIPISFVPSIGISHITVEISRENLYCGEFGNKIPERIFRKSFLALKPSAGLQYDFDNGFSLRTSISFIETRGQNLKTKDSHTFKLKNKPRVNLKDSFVIGFGFIVNL